MKIFIGPSGVGIKLHSSIDARPPARQGDITSASMEGKDTLVLIDGYFTHTLAPWHKEILYAINQGCRVIGAASLGALRAVECERYGMEGVGKIYEWYKDGTCTDDGDVALSHLDENHGYRGCSVPLVNLISTIKHTGLPESMISELRSIYYPDRHWKYIAKILSCNDYDILKHNYIDQKKNDTMLAIKLAGSDSFIDCDKSLNSTNPQMMSLIENDVSIGNKRRWETAENQIEAIDFYLISEMASCLGVFPSTCEINRESQQMWSDLNVQSPEAAAQWMSENGISNDQWNMFAIQMALRQSARDWYNSVTGGLKSTQRSLEYKLFKKA
jgi:hypothetical protein